MLSNMDKANKLENAIADVHRRRGNRTKMRLAIFDILEECDRDQYDFFFALDEREIGLTMLALARLSIKSPIWKETIAEIAKKMHGRDEYEQLRVALTAALGLGRA